MEVFLSADGDPETILQEAARVYGQHVSEMRSLVTQLKSYRAQRKLTPARKIWEIGDLVFALRIGLARLSLELDDLYVHLARDLGVKRKWLEKVIIFRRYLPKEELIPESLNWGRCEKGTRRVAEKLRDGLPLE